MIIGLILKHLDEEYQIAVYKGVREASRQLGFSLICLQGDTFEPVADPERPVFSVCACLPLDGILILSSLLIDNNNPDYSRKLRQFMGDVPIVAIGSEMDNIPCLLVDAREALRELMDHLVSFHRYRRFLYIGGPVNNRDNTIRENSIRNYLTEKESSLNRFSLTVVNGNLFTDRNGSVSIREYIKAHPERDIDAVIAGSDDIALGVMKVLRGCTTGNWAGCPLTGFDDIPRAALEDPPLTTINQPADLLGFRSATILVDLVNKRATTPSVVIPARLIVRESCGCRTVKSNEELSVPSRNLREAQLLRDSGQLGQALMSVGSLSETVSPLEEFLTSTGVKGFNFLIFTEPGPLLPSRARLVCRLNAPEENMTAFGENYVDLKDFFGELLVDVSAGDRAFSLIHLRSGEELLGLLYYSVEDHVQPFISHCSFFLSHTLKRLQVLEKEQAHTRHLEIQVEERTRELAREARRRIAVEAEVLQISELERRRFSMDLHDDICQRLAGMTMICSQIPSTDPHIGILGEMLSETLIKTRRYAHDSFPMEIESLDFMEALKRLCIGMDGLNGCHCVFSGTKDWPAGFGQKEKINIYRIVQEALHNSVSHSGGTELTVTIRVVEKDLLVRITDNGQGDPDIGKKNSRTIHERRPRGLGLKSMEYRAHQLGGEFKINSLKAKGTCVEVRIPLERSDV